MEDSQIKCSTPGWCDSLNQRWLDLISNVLDNASMSWYRFVHQFRDSQGLDTVWWLPTRKPYLMIQLSWSMLIPPLLSFQKRKLHFALHFLPGSSSIGCVDMSAHMSTLTSSSHGTCAQLQQFQVTPGRDMTLSYIFYHLLMLSARQTKSIHQTAIPNQKSSTYQYHNYIIIH